MPYSDIHATWSPSAMLKILVCDSFRGAKVTAFAPCPWVVKATVAAVSMSCAIAAAQTAEGTFELALATNEDVVQLFVGDASSSDLR